MAANEPKEFLFEKQVIRINNMCLLNIMLKWLIDAYFLKNSNVFYTAYSETSDNQFYIQVLIILAMSTVGGCVKKKFSTHKL